MAKGAYIGATLLPSGYTRLSYIESTGTQYIDTGFMPNQDTKIKVVVSDWSTEEKSTSLWGTQSSSSDRYDLYIASKNIYKSYYGGASVEFGASVSYADTVTIERVGNVITIGENSLTNTATTFACTTSLYLFAHNNGGALANKASFRMHSCQIYEKDTIVRDYVPCKNESGVVGLYDLVSATFYADAAGGAFVAGEDVGNTSVARKVKKGYIGIDGLARKIKKAYIGIGGVARPCWGSDPIEYYGEITSLNKTMFEHVGVSAGNYAVFAGGATSNAYNVNAYDSSLTRTVAPNMSDSRFDFAGAYVAESGHTFFAGGLNDDDALVKDVDVYDSSLTKLESETLGTPREQLASATVGKYALFAGGLAEGEGKSTEVEYFYQGTNGILDGSMSSTKDLQTATRYVVGGTNGTHALFYGSESTSTNKLDAYDASLTYSKNTSVGAARRHRSIAQAGGYAIVVGGTSGTGATTTADTNLAIDQSLTITFVDDLQEARSNVKSTSLGGYAVFVGGHTNDSTVGNTSKKVDLYDSSLVHTIANDLNGGRDEHAVASVGRYALVAGGARHNGTSKASTASVEAYVLNEQ